ncbi:MAG TPA: hypothetical protein VFG86_15490 [Chloroflexota bacterium]|jgi:hypothetical protein|nr:hypothetical protein [Chloroflexota bacterium]
MTNPDDPAWLSAVVRRSLLVPVRERRHWQRVIPYLSIAQRYELASTLLAFERWLEES